MTPTLFGVRPLREAADSLAKASTPEPFSASKTSNWIARLGGLPPYVQHIAHDIMEKRGKSESNAIQIALGVVKRWAKGVGNVDSGTRAAAAKAVAQWAKLRAENATKKAAKTAGSALKEDLTIPTGNAADPDADDTQLSPELAAAASRLLAQMTDDELETILGEGSAYLDEVIAAQNEGRNVQEEAVGRVAEAFGGKQAPPFGKKGAKKGDGASSKFSGEHRGAGGSPYGKGSGKCPVCGEPISEHDLGGRLKKPKVEEEFSPAARAAAEEAKKRKHPDWNWGKTTPGDFSHLGTKIPEGSRMAAPKSPAAEAEATYKHHLSFTKALKDGHQYGGSVASKHAVVRFGKDYHLVHTETMMDAHHRDGMPIEKAVEHASLGKADSPEKAAHMMAAVEHGGAPKGSAEGRNAEIDKMQADLAKAVSKGDTERARQLRMAITRKGAGNAPGARAKRPARGTRRYPAADDLPESGLPLKGKK